MTEIQDRMARLAAAAAGDRRLTDPSTSTPISARRRMWPWAAAALLVLVAVAVVAGGDDDDDGSVTAGPAAEVPTSAPVAPVLSIAFTGSPSAAQMPLGLTVTVRDAEGNLLAERTSTEVEAAVDGRSDLVFVDRGLIVELPGEGTYAVEVAGAGGAVTCEVGPVAPGDRVILPIGTGGSAPTCSPVERASDWVAARGDDGVVGSTYVGLSEAAAEGRAEAAGYTTRVVGRDGLDFVITADLDPNRLDLLVFDGVVLGAGLG